MRLRNFALAFAFALLWTGVNSEAQVVANLNQIVGQIELTNTNPDILAILNSAEGPTTFILTAQSVNGPPVTTTTTLPPDTPTSTAYEMTVEAGPPGDGIAYRLRVDMRLDGGQDQYLFLPVVSDPVVEEPAPDVVVDVEECIGVVDMRWIDDLGNPVIVSSSDIFVTRPGIGTHARQFNFFSQSQEYIAVRGDGGTYNVWIVYSIVVDGFQIRFTHSGDVTVSCDEIVEMQIVVPPVDDLARVVGEFDVVGEPEIPRPNSRSQILAWNGPNLNIRSDFLDGPSANGSYELEYLVPSNTVSPPQPWLIQTSMILRDQPGRQQSTRSRAVSLSLGPGETVDLGDTFVMDPGYFHGDVVLQGPPSGEFDSCVADVYRRFEDPATPPTRNFPSQVWGIGTNLNPGAALPSSSGLAQVDFVGGFNPTDDRFEGDYEMIVPLPGNQSEDWRLPFFQLRFLDQDSPEAADSYQDSFLRLIETSLPAVSMLPGLNVEQSLRYCFSQVNLTVDSTGGLFYEPSLRALSRGTFDGFDFEGRQVSYRVDLDSGGGIPLSRGLPIDPADASDSGSLTLCLPQGSYVLSPTVESLNPGGGTSTTGLPRVDFEVGCGQVVDITTKLQISLDPLPQCTATSDLSVTGQVTSDVDVSVIEGSTNDGLPTAFCTDCGISPAFEGQIALQSCDNQVQVSTEDVTGNQASVMDSVRWDGDGPEISGCADVFYEYDDDLGGAIADFALSGDDACEGSRPVTCDVAPGTLLPEGITTVTCTAIDTCGNESVCIFDADVAPACQPVDPDVRTQGFWKRQCRGSHPSGEEENLDEYVAGVSQTATFADVSDVDGLCTELVPDPKNDKCQQAEAQFMAVLLNVESHRVTECNCIDDLTLGQSTVSEAIGAIDAILSDPDRDHASCVEAQAVADRINQGTSLVDCGA